MFDGLGHSYFMQAWSNEPVILDVSPSDEVSGPFDPWEDGDS